MALSSSIIAEAGRYVRTRLLQVRIIVLWLLLTAATAVAVGEFPPQRTLAGPMGFLLLAILTFRLWDDLADIAHDQAHHPERVLVNSRRQTHFAALVVAGLLLLAFLLRDDNARLVLLGFAVILFAAFYHAVPGGRMPRSIRSGLVLVKYPLFVLMAATPSLRAWAVTLALLALLAIHEWLDDGEVPGASTVSFAAGVFGSAAITSAVCLVSGAWS